MKITKIINVALDIEDPISFYSNDDLMASLRKTFLNVCFRGCLINNINKILRVSDCFINQIGPNSFGTINIMFEVEATIYKQYEIINGCEVVHKNDQNIICITKDASIILKTDKYRSIRKGQLISVIVYDSRYDYGEEKISISAIPFQFALNEAPIFKISTIESKLFEPLLNLIAKEEEKTKELKNKNSWKNFTKLLYAYKTDKKLPIGAKKINMFDLLKSSKKQIYVSRSDVLDLTESNVLQYTDVANVSVSNMTDESSSAQVIISFLENYYNFIKTARELCEIYNNNDIIKSHSNLWTIIKKYKKD